jgi:hypothetical protein
MVLFVSSLNKLPTVFVFLIDQPIDQPIEPSTPYIGNVFALYSIQYCNNVCTVFIIQVCFFYFYPVCQPLPATTNYIGRPTNDYFNIQHQAKLQPANATI